MAEVERRAQALGATDYSRYLLDLIAAKQMIHETIERPDLSHDEKAKVLGLNAKRFFRV